MNPNSIFFNFVLNGFPEAWEIAPMAGVYGAQNCDSQHHMVSPSITSCSFTTKKEKKIDLKKLKVFLEWWKLQNG